MSHTIRERESASMSMHTSTGEASVHAPVLDHQRED